MLWGQLPLYRHCSRPLRYHMGPTCASIFGQLLQCYHYRELDMRPAWTEVFGVAFTLLSLDQTPQVSLGRIWDPPKNCFRAASALSLLLWALGHRLDPYFGSASTTKSLCMGFTGPTSGKVVGQLMYTGSLIYLSWGPLI